MLKIFIRVLITFFSGWIEESSIKPYDECKEKYSKASNAALKKAIEKIEEYILKKVVR